MYAAAGGASLASRQARQRQRQNKKTQQASKATSLPAKQPQQFPNYTDHAIVLPPRLSRVERNALRPPTQQQPADRRHSNYHLRATADTPSSGPHAATHHGRLRESPSICIPVQRHLRSQHLRQPSRLDLSGQVQGGAPTPQLPQVHHLLAPQAGAPPERRCSFVRQVEEDMDKEAGGILDRCNHMCNFEVKRKVAEEALLLFAGDCERGAFGGSTDYPFSECSQGRAAWVERERGRRCSVSEEAARQQRLKQSEAHHRWMKRNRIHDTSYGGSSDGYDDDDYSPSSIAYHQSAAANALLYVGLGTAAIGAIIFFVGTGEKGFKTLELRLIGPTLVACGLLCCLVRILLCACPSTCLHDRRKRPTKQSDMETTCRQLSAAAAMLPRPPSIHQQPRHGRPSNEKKVCIAAVAPTLIVPSIAEPLSPSCPDAVEMVPFGVGGAAPVPPPSSTISCFFDMEYELQSVSDDDDDNECEGETVIEVELPKHSRTREPCNSSVTEGSAVTVTADSAQSGCRPQQHSGIVLSASQLQTKQ